jgi:hypothetical protein
MAAGEHDKPEHDDGEAGGFLSRWSRRKAEARREPPPVAEPVVEAEVPALEIDPATLPPIESLTAESDFSLFLKKGVPPAMRAAALRKLWLVEPSVVNYQALVEYNWDFNAPGYGELLPTDDIAQMAQRVFSGFSQDPKPEDQPPAAAGDEAVPQALPAPQEEAVATVPAAEPAIEAEAVVDAAPQPEPVMPSPRRRHGGALPT